MNGTKKLSCLGMIAAVLVAVGTARAAKDAKEQSTPLVQIAILLDTSGSMRGLIDQARAQLWKVVNEFATAEQDGKRAELQVALYQYGSGSLPAAKGYLRRVLPLTTDLDKVSQELFALKIGGSKEYCGQVIQAAADQLAWSGSSSDLKAIFIAGNEPFTQGPVDYRQACKAAIAKGITVNTIHCGPGQQGIAGKWQDGATLADGKSINIDHNRKVAHIAAPQDKEIARLDKELNKTYVPYGRRGRAGAANQAEQDKNAARVSRSSVLQRAAAKASAQYRNVSWDLVDAVRDGKIKLEDIKTEDLPKEIQGQSPAERKAYVEAKAKSRAEVQSKIKVLNEQRKKHVAAEMKKRSEKGEKTLDDAIITAVRAQAKRLKFKSN